MSWRRKVTFRKTRFEVKDKTLGTGGQGKVYLSRRKDNRNQMAVLKTMPASKPGEARLAWLVDSGLGYQLPQTSMPLSYTRKGKDLSYIAPHVDGVPLDEDQDRSFPELLEICWQLCCLWSRLEAVGIAHGDVAASNILIAPDARTDLIDIDNYVTQDPFVPKPMMFGQHAMMAPELRDARNTKQTFHPTMESDRYAWTVLLSCKLLGRHPTDGLPFQTPADFDAEMMSGQWPERRRTPEAGETPIATIGSNLAALFDKGFSRYPNDRPTADDWRTAFGKALQSMKYHACGQVIVDDGAPHCPWCHQAVTRDAATLSLAFSNVVTGQAARFAVDPGKVLVLGRDNLPGTTAHVSRAHLQICLIRKDLRITSIGRNGTEVTFPGKPARPLKTIASALPCTGLDGTLLGMGQTILSLKVEQS